MGYIHAVLDDKTITLLGTRLGANGATVVVQRSWHTGVYASGPAVVNDDE